jgi:hypothetical protein
LNNCFVESFQAEAVGRRQEIYPEPLAVTEVAETEFFGVVAAEHAGI